MEGGTMRRKDFMLTFARTLAERRATLRKTLSDCTDMIAVTYRSVGDVVDAAVDSEQDELDSQLAAVESRELVAIDAALERIRAGSYGICDGCEKPIPVVRLQALPYATRCIKCQREEERSGHERAAAFHWDRVSNESSENEPNHTNGLELEFV
jgi:DnaK suppressor protein